MISHGAARVRTWAGLAAYSVAISLGASLALAGLTVFLASL